MNKKCILAVIAVFVLWSIMDFVIHGLILAPIYAETESLWRPMEEVKMGLGYLIMLIVSTAFVLIYAQLAKDKNVCSGFRYGLLYGIATGVSMGFGSYCWMPIPLSLAWGWMLGCIAETIAAGIVIGAILKSPAQA